VQILWKKKPKGGKRSGRLGTRHGRDKFGVPGLTDDGSDDSDAGGGGVPGKMSELTRCCL
jgi:hypothetical protein